MIEAPHKSIDELTSIRSTSAPNASSFASCDEMARRLDAVFLDGTGETFYALPLSRKQIICAVLSGFHAIPADTSILRSNLCLCSERYLLKVRFGTYDAPLHRFLEAITPKCLLKSQYDILWVLSAQQKINLDSYIRGGSLDAAGIIDLVPTRAPASPY